MITLSIITFVTVYILRRSSKGKPIPVVEKIKGLLRAAFSRLRRSDADERGRGTARSVIPA